MEFFVEFSVDGSVCTLQSVHFVLNVTSGDDVQIVITWAITLLAAAWWLLRPVLTTWKGIAWVAGVLLVVMMCIQVCTFPWLCQNLVPRTKLVNAFLLITGV